MSQQIKIIELAKNLDQQWKKKKK